MKSKESCGIKIEGTDPNHITELVAAATKALFPIIDKWTPEMRTSESLIETMKLLNKLCNPRSVIIKECTFYGNKMRSGTKET